MQSKVRIKVLLLALIFSNFPLWGAWERTDVFLLPNGNTGNGVCPWAICAAGDKIFVANALSHNVSIIDLARGNQVTHVKMGKEPRAICAAGDKVFVANEESNNVSIIDLAQGNQVTNVAVGRKPGAICAFGDKVFVANAQSGSISILAFLGKVEEPISSFSPISSLPYPNPFNSESYIPMNMKCKIYNILG
jgi:YVTN family beta-propeller protein